MRDDGTRKHRVVIASVQRPSPSSLMKTSYSETSLGYVEHGLQKQPPPPPSPPTTTTTLCAGHTASTEGFDRQQYTHDLRDELLDEMINPVGAAESKKTKRDKTTHDETDVFPVELGVVKLPDDVLHLVQRVKLDQSLALRVDLNIARLRVLAEQAAQKIEAIWTGGRRRRGRGRV